MYQVTPYFNDTTGGSFAEGVDALSDLRLAESAQADRHPMLDGYRPGDILVAARYGSSDIIALSGFEAAEQVYARMNSDTRPNGKVERSLSVGDVLHVEFDGGDHWYAVAKAGFDRIADPNVSVAA